MPRVFDGAFGDSNTHHVPPPGTVSQAISPTFRIHQPSSTGTRPLSVSSIRASCMACESGTLGAMGNPVVHFEIAGRDGPALQRFFGELFGWQIDANNPMNYGLVSREGNTNADGAGIGGGISQGPEGYPGHVTFYVEVPDVEAALVKAESLGGTRVMGPEQVMEDLVIGLFQDPEGHTIGVLTGSGQ
jgi:predicted enzyme related to lactoylglutathione lyase